MRRGKLRVNLIIYLSLNRNCQGFIFCDLFKMWRCVMKMLAYRFHINRWIVRLQAPGQISGMQIAWVSSGGWRGRVFQIASTSCGSSLWDVINCWVPSLPFDGKAVNWKWEGAAACVNMAIRSAIDQCSEWTVKNASDPRTGRVSTTDWQLSFSLAHSVSLLLATTLSFRTSASTCWKRCACCACYASCRSWTATRSTVPSCSRCSCPPLPCLRTGWPACGTSSAVVRSRTVPPSGI